MTNYVVIEKLQLKDVSMDELLDGATSAWHVGSIGPFTARVNIHGVEPEKAREAARQLISEYFWAT